MRLRAEIVTVTGKTRHYVEGISVPDPSWIEIAEQKGSIYLFRYASSGALLTDTWHESVEHAKRQAFLEYGIREDEWRDIEPVS